MAGVSEDQWKIMVEDDIQGVFFLDFWIVFVVDIFILFFVAQRFRQHPSRNHETEPV